MPTAIALAIADLHLSLKPPACRADKDWMKVQADYLKQIKDLIFAPRIPVLCGGDVFDRWNPTPELLNFALEHLPDGMVSVPGQHDLPFHRLEDMNRSGYGVLKKAKKIVDISGRPWSIPGLAVYGFAWGQELKSLSEQIPIKGDPIHVALVHKYCWIQDASYPGAPEGSRAMSYYKTLKDYDVAVFGDNHIPFDHTFSNGLKLCNMGTFIRRRSNEIPQAPSVLQINDDGSTKRIPLQTNIDRFHKDAGTREIKESEGLDLEDFFTGLQGLGEGEFNFRDAVKMELDRRTDMQPKVREIIERILKTVE